MILSRFSEHVFFSSQLVFFSTPLEKISSPNEIFSFLLFHLLCTNKSVLSNTEQLLCYQLHYIYLQSTLQHQLPMPPPVNQTLRELTQHPSVRTGEPYSQDMRDMTFRVLANGNLQDPIFQQLRGQNALPSMQTVRRWVIQQQELGHYNACRRNGNITATILRGHDLVLLALYRVIHPKAKHAEINAFLYRANFGDPAFRFYSHSQLSKAEKVLNLTRKQGSTLAFQAFLPINVMKRWRFWNLPFPLGIADIRREDIIDIDEAGIFLETADRSAGKAYVGVRVSSGGPYSKTEKWNLIMGISGEEGTAEQPSRRWRMLWLQGGTTTQKVMQFVSMILNDIGVGTPQRRYTFTMDNLSAHHNVGVAALIYGFGHRLAFRAPYYPTDGPIEYVFNTIQTLLRTNLHRVTDAASLLDEIGNAIGAINDFSVYFINCGFWRN